jgi:hypothetical protein
MVVVEGCKCEIAWIKKRQIRDNYSDGSIKASEGFLETFETTYR